MGNYLNKKTGKIVSIPDNQYLRFKDNVYRDVEPISGGSEPVRLEIPVDKKQIDLEDSIKEVESEKLEELEDIVDEIEEAEEKLEKEASEDIEGIRGEYHKITGKEVSKRYKNDVEYMLKKISEAKDV